MKNNIENSEFVQNTNNKKEKLINKNIIIIISIFVLGIIINLVFKTYIGLLVSIVTIVTGKIIYPKNIIIRVLFWLSILAIIVWLIIWCWMLFTCVNTDWSGCAEIGTIHG